MQFGILRKIGGAMKKWSYFYLFSWLVLAAFFVSNYWWKSNPDLVPESTWLRLQKIFGRMNTEDGSDLVIFIIFIISFFLIFLITLPWIFLWNRKFYYKKSINWLSHPVARVICIIFVTVASFFVFLILGSLLRSVLFPYSMRIELGDYINIPLLIITIIGAIACGNCYRKMSRLSSKEQAANRRII